MIPAESKSSPLDLVRLTALMGRTAGRPEVIVGLIDGPVASEHSDLSNAKIRTLSGAVSNARQANDVGRSHGTFVAGMLAARRGSIAPAICPNCTLLVRPIFLGTAANNAEMPRATPDELADAIVECVEAGAQVLNLSVAVAQPSLNREPKLEQALDYATRRGVIIVAAAGNQGTLGGTAITRHTGVIPVAASDLRGRPLGASNFGNSIGRRGLSAPGEAITSLGTNRQPLTLGGTSAAVPFVTGAVALLWSAFPASTAAALKHAMTAATPTRRTVVPPLLNAVAAYDHMSAQ